jgi:hypothetical protein
MTLAECLFHVYAIHRAAFKEYSYLIYQTFVCCLTRSILKSFAYSHASCRHADPQEQFFEQAPSPGRKPQVYPSVYRSIQVLMHFLYVVCYLCKAVHDRKCTCGRAARSADASTKTAKG